MDVNIPFLGELAKLGVLGVLLAISIAANIYFVRIILSQVEKRVEDAKEITTKIANPLETIKNNGDLLILLFKDFLKNGAGK